MNRTNLTSEQAEALIAGTTSDESLDDLSNVIDSLRSYQSAPLDDALVDRIVSAASKHVSDPAEILPVESAGRTRYFALSRQSLRRQIATVAAAVAVLFASGSSVAFAANGASPGDTLYGIDRAFEAIGIGDGGTQERLQEAEDLVANGEVALGLEHAAKAMTAETSDSGVSDSQQAASVALELAAERARGSQSNASDATKEGVAALLEYLSGNIGHVDGQMVAELAQNIGNKPSSNPSDSNSAAPGQSNASNQGNAPEVPPGQSKKDSESPPSDQGKAPDEPPGQSGASDTESPPSDQGKAPDEPPGQSKKNSEENAPASPPQSNSGNSSKPGKTK